MVWTWIRIVLYVTLGAISIRYGFFVRLAGAGNTFYRIWFLLGAVLILLAPAAYFRLWGHVPKWFRYVVVTLVALGIGVYVSLLLRITSKFQTESEEVDYLIVLGAQVRDDGPSRVLLYRLETAEQYLREHPKVICIVSGGKGANEPVSEAECMRDWLVAHGIDAFRIILEDRSTDTSENLKYSMALLPSEETRVGIVTNNFHMYRALGIAYRCGYRHYCGVPATSTKEYLPHNLTREVVGVMKDVIMGHMPLY